MSRETTVVGTAARTADVTVQSDDVNAHSDLVTVLIPARNEEEFIAACLDAVLVQTYSNIEVIVIDGASTDGTAAVIGAYTRLHRQVRMLSNPRAKIPVSLNLGVAAATGRFIVRVDAHATVNTEYVERAVRHLRTGQWAGVGGRVDAVGVTATGRAVSAVMSSRFGIGNSVHHYGTKPTAADHVPFPGYPTALVRDLGGWAEELDVNQDFEFDYRLGRRGHRLLYDPGMVIHYHCQQSLSGVFRQFRRYGRGKAKVVRLHPDSMRARHLVAPALVASWAISALLARRNPWLVLAANLPYAVAVGAGTLAAGPQLRDAAARRRLPIVFAAVHVAWGLGFWEGLLASHRHSPDPR
jgi:cellulose synthase/poly-beta-1,6-N-acetylglucosamine synthase-like glycosyltransferase